MAYQKYLGDRYFANTSGSLPTGVMDGAVGIAYDNLRQYVKYQGYWQILPIGIVSGDFSGSGTTNYITKWASSNDLTVSQIFDNGTNVGIGTALPSYLLHVDGDIASADQFISLVSTGTAPFVISSTTLVSNLNSDLLDNQQGAYYLDYNNFTNTPTIGNGTITITAGTGLTGGGTFAVNQAGNTTITLNASDVGASQNIFKNIVVSGQSTIVADSNDDSLTFASGTGITLTTNATTDTLTITNSGVTSNVAGTGISVSGATGAVTITNTGVLSVNGVTGAVTATHLLTAIKTVDGIGSGLDSDLLDGQSGAYYLDYTNFTNTPDINNSTINITAGSGMTGGGSFTLNQLSSATITLTNNDKGSSQNIFKTIAVTGQLSIVADSNSDTLTFANGSGINITTNDITDTLTITNTGVISNVAGTGISVSGATGAVTISNAGVLSVNGVTGAVTAANLLTALLTVDGAGSTLDADLLDAQSGAYYLDYTNFTNTPTIGNGTITVTASTGLSGSSSFTVNQSGNTTITLTNTDLGSSQFIFKNVAVSGQSTIVADSNNDTLTLASGTGITLTTNATTDTLTITNSGVTSNVAGTGISVSGATGAVTISNTGVLSVNGVTGAVTAANLLTAILTVDGSGSTLDADLLDGIDSGSFLRSDATDTATGLINFNAGATITSGAEGAFILKRLTTSTTGDDITHIYQDDGGINFVIDNDNDLDTGNFSVWYKSVGVNVSLLSMSPTTFTYKGNTIWHSGNDGVGSGLDSDLLDGQSGAYYLDYNNFTNTPTIGNGTITVTASTGLSGSSSFTVNQSGNTTITLVNTDLGSSQLIFKNIAVSGQSTIVADSNNDTLTFASGTGITLTTNATTDTLTITNSGVTSNVAGTGISVSGATGAVTISNTGVLSVNGVTGAVTAANLLTALLTVDGVGSGLDSDLLDGQQGTYYLNTSSTAQTKSGVLTLAPSAGAALIIDRVGGSPSIKAGATDGYIMIDSTGQYLSLNHYVSDNVNLAYGGGNVGIGNNAPSYRLDVTGNTRITSTALIDDHAINVVAAQVNNTPTHGYLILTGIPFNGGFQMPTVIIEGYSYGSGTPLCISICWYVYSSAFTSYGYTNTGGWSAGTVSLSSHSDTGNVCIHLSTTAYFNRFNIRVIAGGTTKSWLMSGWSIVDSTSPTNNKVTVPLRALQTSISGNSDTVDNLHATSFIRSDADDTASGNYTFSGLLTTTGLGTGTDNTVVILNSSNQLTTDEIDSRVWGNSLIDGSGTLNYISKWSGSNSLINSQLFDNGTNVGIGTASPSYKFHVVGTAGFSSTFYLTGIGTGTDNSVLILNSSNQVVTDEIDGRVWGNTLVDSTGTQHYIPKFTDTNSLENSVMYESSSKIGVNTTSVVKTFDINGSLKVGTESSYGQITIDTVGVLPSGYEGSIDVMPYTTTSSGTAQFVTRFVNNVTTGTTEHDVIVESRFGVGGLFADASYLSYNLEVEGTGAFSEYIYHRDDDDTFIRFTTSQIEIQSALNKFIFSSSGLTHDGGIYDLGDNTNRWENAYLGSIDADGTVTLSGLGSSSETRFIVSNSGGLLSYRTTLPLSSVSDLLLFKNIAVSGQSTIVADSSADTLTFASGTGITLTTNATTDTLTITNSGVTSNVAGTGISVSGATGAVTISNTGVLSVNGVTGAVTAANLLTALLTVDGAGSGLDADLLDGLNSTTLINNTGLGYQGPASIVAGWYTIATNTGDRAIARFGLRDTTSGLHQSIIFYASHTFGGGNTITVLHNSRFGSTSPFRYIRIKDGSTYEGAVLQVYVNTTLAYPILYLLGDNFQSSGWVVKNWIADATDPSDVDNYGTMGIATQVDLDVALNGGIITTGDYYGGGATTQYKLWHSNNDGAGSTLDADLLDGQQGTYYLDYNNFTNTPTIGNGTITVTASTGLSGSSSFTVNQSGNTTITLTNTDLGSSQFIFKNVAVSGQSTIVADSNNDTLTLASGTGVTITTNATTDTLTITNSGVTSNVAGTGISVSGATGAVTIGNTGVLSVNGLTGAITAENLLTALLTVDGAGSGLDADLLDGRNSTQFLNYSENVTIDVNTALGTHLYSGSTSPWTNRGPSVSNAGALLSIQTHSGNYYSQFWFDTSGNNFYFRCANNALPTGSWQKVWHAGNDGASSTLDADLLDGQHGTYYLDYNNFANTPTIGNGTITVTASTGLSGSSSFTVNQSGNTTITLTNTGVLSVNGVTGAVTAANLLTALLTVDGASSTLDADLLDGVQGSSYLRSDVDDTASGIITFNSASAYPITINGTSDAKIVLAGSSNPYIRFREGSTDRAYIQWNAANNSINFVNQEGSYFWFYGTSTIVGHRLLTSDGTTRGFLYANNNNDIGLLDAGGDWAIRHLNDQGTYFFDTATLRAVIGSDLVAGTYGTIEVKDGSGKGGYDGYTIQDGSTHGQSFMSNGTTTGLYDGANNTFRFYYDSADAHVRTTNFDIRDTSNVLQLRICNDNDSTDQGVPWIRTDSNYLVLNAVDGGHVYLNWDTSGGGSGDTYVYNDVFAKRFVDRDDANYLVDPASTSTIRGLILKGSSSLDFNFQKTNSNLFDSKFELWPSFGALLNRNTEFYNDTDGYLRYDNANSGAVAISRVVNADAPNSSGAVMRITYTTGIGTPSPAYGGFYINSLGQGSAYQKGDVIIYRVLANIPVGRSVVFTSNAYGTESTANWLTSTTGTGDWKEYIYFQKIGQTGTLSTTGYFYISGGTDATFYWDVARIQANTPMRDEGIYRSSNVLYHRLPANRFLFNGSSGGTAGYVPYYSDADHLSNSNIYYNGTNVGIGTVSPSYVLDVIGAIRTTTNLLIGQYLFHDGDADTYLDFYQADGFRTVVGAVETIRTNTTETVINEGSADHNFRVESNNNTHCLFVDGGTDNVGIGISSPLGKFHAAGDGTSISYLFQESNNVDTSGPAIYVYRTRGTVASSTNVQVGDSLGGMVFAGYVDGAPRDGASWLGKVSAIDTGTDRLAVDVVLSTRTLADSSLQERFTLFSNGTFKLHAYGSGAITGSPTYNLSVDASGNIIETSASLDGSGTQNYVAKFIDGNTLGNSQIFDNGTNVGIGTASPADKLHIQISTNNEIGFHTAETSVITDIVTHGPAIRFSRPSDGTNNIAGIFTYQGGAGTNLAITTRSDIVFACGGASTYGNSPERLRLSDSGHLIPYVDSSQDLGTTSKRWRYGYVDDIIATNNILAGDGSAASPSLSFNSDTNTGIFKSGTDILGFSCGGSAQLTLSTSTADFQDNIITTSNYIQTSNYVRYGNYLYSTNNRVSKGFYQIAPPANNFGNAKTYLRLYVLNTAAKIYSLKVRISGSWSYSQTYGYLEAEYYVYNTTLAITASSGFRIVSGFGYGLSNLRIGNVEVENGYVSIPIWETNTNGITVELECASISTDTSDIIGNLSNTSWVSDTLPSVIYPTIDRLGLGGNHTNPTYTLDVDGTARVNSTFYLTGISAGTDNTVLVINGSGQVFTDEIDPRVWGSSLLDGSGTLNYISKWTAGSTLGNSIIYDNGTNVGIGNASPSYKLHVTGTGYFSGNLTAGSNLYVNGTSIYFDGGSSALRSDNFFSFLTDASGAQTAKFKSIQVSTSYSGTIPDNGILFFTDTNLYRSAANTLTTDDSLIVIGDLTTSGNFTETSSLKYKENISNYSVNINRFNQLNPVRYTRKIDQKEDIGFIAEELNQIMPEYVEFKDGEPESVKYSKMVTMLVSVTQQLFGKIDKLEKEIADLKKKSKISKNKS